MRDLLLVMFLCLTSLVSFAQDENKTQGNLKISGFVDTYYTYSFNTPDDKNIGFATQPARHNEFNLNWGILQADYEQGKLQASLALQAGTFVRNNYAGEAAFIRNIYLANVSYQVFDQLKVTLGIREAAINLEDNLSIYNPIYSRSFASDIMPYYQSGLAFVWTPSEKFSLDLSIINGYQRIQDNNSAKSLAITAKYQLNDQLLIGYGNYIGNDNPDSLASQVSFFNDFYAQYDITEKLQVAATIEVNAREKFNEAGVDLAFDFFAWLRYKFTEKLSAAIFFETYRDPEQIFIFTGTPNGFTLNTASLNVAYRPEENIAIRLESKFFNAPDNIFPKENQLSDTDAFVSLSMALKF
ncbi:MAG TPA: hypothetical protein DCS93_33855 [Microscillaceae bacterium]|nr:hypothetical protein [Microscillaceae bacterium]